ncbi:hypothetical protein NLX67_09085 [Domibacillus sp. A3M-37]|uniref:hypothetical protein n=1 Tax=Domibacillus sp. A3M-37 TaxID=2962037 RepID=UPI0020B8CEA6|nr:hypothetical protein [Domibacillus sp. A3M-37]MCP3762543.1 hypothetical protein [Domibacillus sp. A3M-37]
MKNFTISKRTIKIKQFLSFCLLLLLYTVVNEIWLAALYTNNTWNISGIVIVAILLVPLYTFINTRLSLGVGKYIFYIPILPAVIGMMLFQPIVFSIFPNPYPKDDLGIGILMMMITFPHWIAMMLSFLLAHKIKMRRKDY